MLAKRGILHISGERRSQECYWNKERCKPNEKLTQSLYEEYISTLKKQLKIEKKERLSIDSCLQYLIKAGWTGSLTKIKLTQYGKTVEYLDLEKLAVRYE